ncbi:MAG: peptidoglycan DD-metalloendopeptidase family protein [Methylococcales bacterium]|nr:peptidoglycan DD-metalloendopeptidase family protein [Methylococcales bacterium]
MMVLTQVGGRLITCVGLAALCAACASGVPAQQSPKSPASTSKPYAHDLSGNQRFYTVQPGDTLYAIGFRSGHGYRVLAQWNGIAPPYTIKIGQRLRLFPPPDKPKKQLKAPLARQSSKTKKQENSVVKDNKLKLYWKWPIQGKVVSDFVASGRKGIDIAGRAGQAVAAAEAGKVVYAGSGLRGYGNLVIVKHNETFLSAYANNQALLVQEGQRVNKGQAIAEVGKNALGQPRLHFQIRQSGKPVNPLNFLP